MTIRVNQPYSSFVFFVKNVVELCGTKTARIQST